LETSELSLLFVEKPFSEMHYNALYFWHVAVLHDEVNNITRLRVRRTEAIVALERALTAAKITYRPGLDQGLGDTIDYVVGELCPDEIIQLFPDYIKVVDSRQLAQNIHH